MVSQFTDGVIGEDVVKATRKVIPRIFFTSQELGEDKTNEKSKDLDKNNQKDEDE